MAYTYTPTGQRKTVLDTGRSLTSTVPITYTYDNRDRLKSITLPGAAAADLTYIYDKGGRIAEPRVKPRVEPKAS